MIKNYYSFINESFDYKFLKKYIIYYDNAQEGKEIADALVELGLTVNNYPNSDYSKWNAFKEQPNKNHDFVLCIYNDTGTTYKKIMTWNVVDMNHDEFFEFINKFKDYFKANPRNTHLDVDPYGEEDWLNEAKSDKGQLLDLQGNIFANSRIESVFKTMIDMGFLTDEIKRNRIINLIDGTIGKKVVFYNSKDGKNLKKERISEGARWEQINDDWSLFLKGTKKDYLVNIYRPFAYYGDKPKRIFNEIDPYGEEDWDN